MKGIYLAACKARHPEFDIVYQDINPKFNCDLGGDMMDVDLSIYDFIIATPPCNYWSRANYRRDKSDYSLKTKHLLIDILNKLCNQDKPFIVENVRSGRLFKQYNLYDLPCHIYFIGRHTYWTNVLLPSDILQRMDFKYGGYVIKYDDIQHISSAARQGGYNVKQVIDIFLYIVKDLV